MLDNFTRICYPFMSPTGEPPPLWVNLHKQVWPWVSTAKLGGRAGLGWWILPALLVYFSCYVTINHAEPREILRPGGHL